jgi:hypothetical protein
MWLVDHQMNMQVQERFGAYFVRLPLTAAASIHNTNALTSDWERIVPKNELSYILGNPPFLGYSIMDRTQKLEVENIFEGMRNSGTLDYVTAWYKKAAQYIHGTEIEVAFVSTNSICQGEQVHVLWPELMNRHGIKINFAHHTFKWSNEGRKNAAVYCIIAGFSLKDRNIKKIYHYAAVTSEPSETIASQINAYLIDAPILFIDRRTKPLCKVSEMIYGNKPTDNGLFFLDQNEKDELLAREPNLKDIIKPFLGAHEFINNIPRYCFWLDGVSPSKYKRSKELKDRLNGIKAFRESSQKEATRRLAEFPSLFGEIRQPRTDYILVPRHSSERRKYIPIGFVSKNVIIGDSNSCIPNATLYEFGIITSIMHMAWMRYVCGRIKSDYRYSGTIVYNNFPWPKPSDKQKKNIEKAAQGVFDVRNIFSKDSFAVLYDPLTMPPKLVKVHQKLDKAVEVAYGRTFDDDSQRVAYLFELYQKLSSELFVDKKKRGKGRKL